MSTAKAGSRKNIGGYGKDRNKKEEDKEEVLRTASASLTQPKRSSKNREPTQGKRIELCDDGLQVKLRNRGRSAS